MARKLPLVVICNGNVFREFTCSSVICFPHRINWHYQFIAIQTFYRSLVWEHKIVYQNKLETKTTRQDWKHALTFTVH